MNLRHNNSEYYYGIKTPKDRKMLDSIMDKKSKKDYPVAALN